jgi:hypothetical protein
MPGAVFVLLLVAALGYLFQSEDQKFFLVQVYENREGDDDDVPKRVEATVRGTFRGKFDQAGGDAIELDGKLDGELLVREIDEEKPPADAPAETPEASRTASLDLRSQFLKNGAFLAFLPIFFEAGFWMFELGREETRRRKEDEHDVAAPDDDPGPSAG